MPASNTKRNSVIDELVLTRTFDAPRELVFKAWTDAKQLAEWWGPKGFTNPVCDIDVRPGGAIRIDMTGPDGTVYPMGGTSARSSRRSVSSSARPRSAASSKRSPPRPSKTSTAARS